MTVNSIPPMLELFSANCILCIQPHYDDNMYFDMSGSLITLIFPTMIGFLLAIFILWLYPLHGKYLSEIRETLEKKRGMSGT